MRGCVASARAWPQCWPGRAAARCATASELLSSQMEGFVVFVLNTTSLEGLRTAVNRLLGRPVDAD